MGVTNLNKLTKHENVKTYNAKTLKANTAIIDGNNLLFNRFAAIRSSYIDRFKKTDFKTIQEPLLNQIFYMLKSTVDSIIKTILAIYSTLSDEHNIMIVFDPPGTPNYYTNEGIKTFKRDEEKTRTTTQITAYMKKINEVNNIIDLDYSDISNELKYIYYQVSYILNDANNMKFSGIIKNEILYALNKSDEKYKSQLGTQKINETISDSVYLIQSVSEADLVIYNLCLAFNYKPIIIYSMDSDYFVLCSCLKNIYKTDITLNKDVYNTYDIWRDVFDDKITFKDIVSMATISGNDFTAHDYLFKFDCEKFQKMYNHNFKFRGISKRSKIYNYVYLNDLKEIAKSHSKVNEPFKNSLMMYDNMTNNFEFKELKQNEKNIEMLLKQIKNDILTLVTKAEINDIKINKSVGATSARNDDDNTNDNINDENDKLNKNDKKIIIYNFTNMTDLSTYKPIYNELKYFNNLVEENIKSIISDEIEGIDNIDFEDSFTEDSLKNDEIQVDKISELNNDLDIEIQYDKSVSMTSAKNKNISDNSVLNKDKVDKNYDDVVLDEYNDNENIKSIKHENYNNDVDDVVLDEYNDNENYNNDVDKNIKNIKHETKNIKSIEHENYNNDVDDVILDEDNNNENYIYNDCSDFDNCEDIKEMKIPQKIIDNKRKLEIYENLKTQNKQFKKILHNDYEIDGIDDVEI